MKYWEDMVGSPAQKFGPLVFSTDLLDKLLDLLGEKHPVHASDDFARATLRKQRIIPGSFIHSITSGWMVQQAPPVALLGLRSMSWDFVRPLYPETPFYFTTEIVSAEEIDEHVGLVNTVRRVFDESGRAYAIGRMNVVIMRRSSRTAVGGGYEES